MDPQGYQLMQRYFLHLHECETVLEDVEGHECATLQEATRMAVVAARDIMAGELRAGQLCLTSFILIADSLSNEVGRVSFRDVVLISGL
jgi:hypothetical protein